ENNGPVRGGPAPGDAHLTVVLLRLNPDGSIPDDNPFVDISASFQAPRSSGPDTAGPAVAGVVLHGVSQPGAGHVHRGHRLGEPGRPNPGGGAFITLGGSNRPAGRPRTSRTRPRKP